ncbi:hypothetical protein KCU85_g3210, partial [Aureobasidium melanogenum]
MAQVKILKRSRDAVSCSSCKQRYDLIEALDQHLETSLTGRRICPRTKAPALIVCIECERDFPSVQELKQHIQNSLFHHPELSEPTGRVVFVGRLPANVRERDIVNILFDGFIVETTSIRTHCPHFDNFAFITLTTAAEANRAVKVLHNKRFFNQKVIVSLQRPKEDPVTQASGRKPRSRILSMAPSYSSTKPPAMASGKENTGPLPPVNMQLPQSVPAYAQPLSPPFDPRMSTFLYNTTSAVVYNQYYPALPYHPPAPDGYGQFGPSASFSPAPVNRNLRYQSPPSFVPNGTLPATQPPHQSTTEQRPCRQRGRRKQFPPQYDGASNSPTASPPIVTEPENTMLPITADTKYDSAVQTSSSCTTSTSSMASSTSSPYCDDQTWPPLVSSGPATEARAWTSFHDDQYDDAYRTLVQHCHDANSLVVAGFNIREPTMPPLADLRAKVKCRSCRSSRQHLDRLIAESGVRGCPVAKNGMHTFGGISHLTSLYEDFEHPPAVCPSSLIGKCRAIALDCEMAGGRIGDGLVNQVIQLTAIDYFSGEVLISALVKPTLVIQQWRTNIHGVSPSMMSKAVNNGTALENVFHARELLFSFMNSNTILVGHALHNDLNVLKIAHDRCVDSEILAKVAIDRASHNNGVGLKKLCDTLLGLSVQRTTFHSCLEDTFAAREAVIYMVSHPEELSVWAQAKQKVIDEEAAKRAAAKQAKEEAREQAAANEVSERAARADDKRVKAVLTMAMPALVPNPVNEIPDELQMYRGPSVGKKRKGGAWKVLDYGGNRGSQIRHGKKRR